MNDLNGLSVSLTDTLKKSDLQEVTIDMAEVGLDSLMTQGVLRDIPFIGAFVGLAKTAVSIKDAQFLKKMIYFLTELHNIPADKRDKQIRKIEEDPNYNIKVGEKLLYIIEKCDDHSKAEIIGKLFKCYLEEKLDYDDFLRASVSIEKLYLDDFKRFIKEKWESMGIEEGGEFVGAGLMDMEYNNPKLEQWPPDAYLALNMSYKLEKGEMRCKRSYLGIKLQELLSF